MAVFLAGLEQVGLQDEIAENSVGDERDVDWGTNRRLVITLRGQLQRGYVIRLGQLPRVCVGHHETVERVGMFKVLRIKQRVTFWQHGSSRTAFKHQRP